MKLSSLHIKNFRSCKDVDLEICNMHALVGGNNAGKSTILRALDFLFNPSAKSINEESFWNKDMAQEIRIEAIFSALTAKEKKELAPYLKANGTFHIARSAKMGTDMEDFDSIQEDDENKVIIGQSYCKPVPQVEWLQECNISTSSIKKWWEDKAKLIVNGLDFSARFEGTKQPNVIDWKAKADEFIQENAGKIPMEDSWIDNPKGYAGVLKGTLPFFVLVPAVRNVTDESKATKSSPFGKLLSAILNTVTEDKREKIKKTLDEISKQVNRIGGAERVPLITETEDKLNDILKNFFTGCDLEIEFETPTLEVLLSSPKLYIDDGFRNSVENKGHGLQRAVIFTILRRYAEYMTFSSEAEEKKRNLILAVEEPELYMHPQAQRTIRRVFRQIADSGDQILFSTHSSLLVDVSYFDEIVRMECERNETSGKKTNVSKAYQLPMSNMIKDILTRIPNLKDKVTPDSIRELYSHAYNPHRNEGFFASKIILVEGLTEEYSLSIYADAIPDCIFDQKNISVVECGGKCSMDRLFRIFNELHIPCYMLFDYDKGNSDKDIVAKSRELLGLAGEKQEEPGTLLVLDSIACFPEKWEVSVMPEIDNYDAMATECRKELGFREDSKPLIARYIARKLTTKMPPFIPPSIEKIIKKAVAVTWKSSCLKLK